MQFNLNYDILYLSYLGLFSRKGDIKLAGKRKDRKGRVLQKNESQRTDGLYQYNYKDPYSKVRKYLYAKSLNELREKEKELWKQLDSGVDYNSANITVYELVEQYIGQLKGRRDTTIENYKARLKMVEKEPVIHQKIMDVKVSNAKYLVGKMHEDGRAYKTITSVVAVLKAAYNMAIEDEVVVRNPFKFRMNKVLENDTEERTPLTVEEQRNWLIFLWNDETYSKYFDMFALLLFTGVRVSELCGLTVADLDFVNRKISINKQLKKRGGKYFIDLPKTKAGKRSIGMNDNAYFCFKHLLDNRDAFADEPQVDGYSGFLFFTQDGKPMVGENISSKMAWAEKKYNKLHADHPITHVFPHRFRHTFCTEYMDKVSLKELQALMGHETPTQILNVYAHANRERAAEKMAKSQNVIDISTLRATAQKKMRG